MERGHLEAQFNRAHISKRDFEEVLEYLHAFHSRLRAAPKRAILLAAIIAYVRPFTQSRSGIHKKATSALSGNPRSILSEQEHLLHKKLVALRHEVLAHSSYDRKSTSRVSGRVSSVSRGFIVRSRPFDLLAERIDIKLFCTICEKMINYCTDKLFELNHRLESTNS